MTTISQQELRDAFGAFLTGVTVVTTQTNNNTPIGFTANSYTSVSLDPPLLLVCPGKALSSFEIFNQCEHFAVNILAEDQQDISNIFASASDDRFSSIDWTTDANGSPLIKGASVSFSCATEQHIDAGDHIILLGRVLEVNNASLPGLGYCSDGYFSLGLERKAAELAQVSNTNNVGAIIECEQQILLQESQHGLELPVLPTAGISGSLGDLKDHLTSEKLNLNFGQVYSIFNDQKNDESFIFYRAQATTATAYSGAKYYPLEEINTLNIGNDAIKSMLQRYAEERKQGVFNLYIGNQTSGDVHPIGEQ